MEFSKKLICFLSLFFAVTAYPQATTAPNSNPGSVSADMTANMSLTPQKAIAVIYPTSENKVKGIVTFTKADSGIKITADLSGLTPGEHGFHVHEYGDCSAADGSSAGGHFNPYKKSHGGPEQAIHHAGDFGNIVADPNGNAHYETNNSSISLDSPNSIIGHALIIHASVDDLSSQPAGNSGARIGCGVIGIANPK